MATATEKTTKKKSGLGLESIGDLSELLSRPSETGATRPQELALDCIDEDLNQPRRSDNPGFSHESLEELATTIRDRGVKSPISVRENPEMSGRYIINHGARRYRASRMAGKTTIPAFVDNDYCEADQVIENLQRNELTPREIADFIGRELARGKKKNVIAKEIGKSPAFISQHVTLLDLPEPIAMVFNVGRTNDVTVINELVTAHKKNPEDVQVWLEDENQELTRGSVKLLREFLEDKGKQIQEEEMTETDIDVPEEENSTEVEEPSGKKPKVASDPDKLKKAIVQVLYKDRTARLMLDRRPPQEGWAWLKGDNGEEYKADLSQVTLVAVIEA